MYFLGITSNLFFVAVLCVTSWYQLINSEEYINYKISRQRALELSEKRLQLRKRDTDGKLLIRVLFNFTAIYLTEFISIYLILDSSSIDDSSFVEEFPDTSTRAGRHQTGKKERDFVEVLSSSKSSES